MLLADLIEGVATDTGQPKAVVDAVARGVLARIEGAVRKGETINLVGFGASRSMSAAPGVAATSGPAKA